MAGLVTSLIVFPYIREQTISDTATVKNGEGVFTHTSPRSSAPVTVRGTPAEIGCAGPAGAVTELRTGSHARASHGWALKGDVYMQEAVLKWLTTRGRCRG